MRELRQRAEQIARIVCIILAGLVVYELAGVAIRWNPFRGVAVPELPTLTVATNGPSSAPHATNLMANTTQKGTNALLQQTGTNMALAGMSNSAAHPVPSMAASNSIVKTEVLPAGSNSVAVMSTNPPTNSITQSDVKPGGTNMVAPSISTNAGTNLTLVSSTSDTNAATSKPKKKRTNGGPMPEMAGMSGMVGMPGMPGIGFNPFGPPGMQGPDLPPALKARVDRITESEILGPVMRPLPMALLGIAGEFAFLRSDSGQTGLVKEGDSLADLKLLRIGVNRVLIEQNGQKKELMIFNGYGGDSLLPKDSPNENAHP